MSQFGGADLNALMAQAQQLQQKMVEAQEKARQLTAEASSGGGMVTATVSGALELRKLVIDPQAVDPRDVGMLQDLVIAAVNQAIKKAQEMIQQEMQQVTGGLLPPGMGF